MEPSEKAYLDQLLTIIEAKNDKIAEKFEKYAEKYGKLTQKYASLESKLDSFLNRWFFKRPEFYITILPYFLFTIAFCLAWYSGQCIKIGSLEFHCSC